MTGLPDGWNWVPLVELTENLDRFRRPVSATERAKRPGDTPYYGATGRVGTIAGHLFDEQLLLLGEDGVSFLDAGKEKSYLISGKTWVNNHAHVLRVGPKIEPTLLKHYLDQFDYRNYVTGTTRLKLTKAAANLIPVPVPPLEEQKILAEKLDVDLGRIDRSLVHLKKVETLTAALISATLRAGTAAQGYPQGWESVSLGDIARVGSGATPARSNSSYYLDGTIPWVTSSDLATGDVREVRGRITEKALRETAVKLWPSGCLLVAMYGEGRTRGTVAELHIQATTNQACAVIQLHPEHRHLQSWVRMFLESRYIAMRQISSGGVQPNLSIGQIRNIEVPLPPEPERSLRLQAVSAARSNGVRLSDVTARLTRRVRATRGNLVREAFSGRLVEHSTRR